MPKIVNDIRNFIALCEEEGEFKRLKAEVDWDLELSHIAKLSEEKGGPLLFFENVKGYDTPVVTSIFSKPSRLALTLGMSKQSSIFEMAKMWTEVAKKGGIPPKLVKSGPIMENIKTGDDVDILSFPIPRYFPDDVGRFFGTAHSVITRDPESGYVNLGTYRMEVLDKKSLGCYFIKGKDGEINMKKYAAQKKAMPVAASIGGDPRLFFLSGSTLPYGTSEYDIVGALRGEPVEVIESDVTGLPIPAHAEIVVEGFVNPDPGSFRDEGPFGEYTGYYSGARSPKPCLEIKRILHRNQPIFWAETVGRPPQAVIMLHAVAKTAALWSQLQDMKIPGIRSVCFSPASGRFWVVISVRQMYPGHARQVAMAALGTAAGHYGVKGVIVVDDDIQADDWDRVMEYTLRSGTSDWAAGRGIPDHPGCDNSLPLGQEAQTMRAGQRCRREGPEEMGRIGSLIKGVLG
jgi:4-hydroxy-3-polyprenylbenzoate decarboxylase